MDKFNILQEYLVRDLFPFLTSLTRISGPRQRNGKESYIISCSLEKYWLILKKHDMLLSLKATQAQTMILLIKNLHLYL